MNEVPKLLTNKTIIIFVLHIILLIILYMVVYNGFDKDADAKDVIFITFATYIVSKYILDLLFISFFPSKCVLDSDKQHCRF